MRTIFILILLAAGQLVQAQQNSTKTFTLLVKGNCDECKTRIENAADMKGVKLCVWNETTQTATITYKPEKVSPAQIEKAIAASGHDAGDTRGDDASYKALPSCCKYRDKKCEEKK